MTSTACDLKSAGASLPSFASSWSLARRMRNAAGSRFANIAMTSGVLNASLIAACRASLNCPSSDTSVMSPSSIFRSRSSNSCEMCTNEQLVRHACPRVRLRHCRRRPQRLHPTHCHLVERVLARLLVLVILELRAQLFQIPATAQSLMVKVTMKLRVRERPAGGGARQRHSLQLQ